MDKVAVVPYSVRIKNLMAKLSCGAHEKGCTLVCIVAKSVVFLILINSAMKVKGAEDIVTIYRYKIMSIGLKLIYSRLVSS